MAGDGSVGYLHGTQPTLTSGSMECGSNVYRLRQDEACGVTIDIRPPLHSDTTVEIQFAEVHFRDAGAPIPIDILDPTQYGQLPTKETLETEQKMQAGLSPLNSDRLSRRDGFRIWKNASESGRTTLEVYAIASISIIRNTPRTVSGEPPLYQFVLLVAGKKVLLHYCFVDRRRAYLGGEQLLSAPPKRDSGRGMFFAGSAPATPKTLDALKARSDERPDDLLEYLLEQDPTALPVFDEDELPEGEAAGCLPACAARVCPTASPRLLFVDEPPADGTADLLEHLLEQELAALPACDAPRRLFVDPPSMTAEQLDAGPFADKLLGTPSEQRSMLPLVDMTPDELSLAQSLSLGDPSAGSRLGAEDDPIKPKSCGSPDCMAGTAKFLGGVYEGRWYVCICKPYEARAEDNPPPPGCQ